MFQDCHVQIERYVLGQHNSTALKLDFYVDNDLCVPLFKDSASILPESVSIQKFLWVVLYRPMGKDREGKEMVLRWRTADVVTCQGQDRVRCIWLAQQHTARVKEEWQQPTHWWNIWHSFRQLKTRWKLASRIKRVYSNQLLIPTRLLSHKLCAKDGRNLTLFMASYALPSGKNWYTHFIHTPE